MLRYSVKMKIIKVCCGLLLVLCLWLRTVDISADERGLAQVLVDHLKCYPVALFSFKSQKPSIVRKDLCLAAIYHKLGAKPLWVSEDGPGIQAKIILKYLKNAGDEGLSSADYQVEKIERLWADSNFESLAELDTLLTYGVVKYIHDVSYGQLRPYMVNPELFAEAGERGFDPLIMIETILATENLDDFFQSLPPSHRQYRGLKNALIYYSRLKYSGEWKVLADKSIRPGNEDERIAEIRKRIALLENVSVENSESVNSAFFDNELLKKVLVFQRKHGLEQDGIIGRNTIRELNRSPDERLAQIRVNMARWRWQDHELGDKYILVNIANYTLYAYKAADKLEFSMPVIVGKLQHQTPVFSGRIKYLEFNPYWNVPPSIARNETLPKLQKDSNYLVKENIRLFSNWQEGGIELDSTAIDWSMVSPSEISRFKLRQNPGPGNALGRVKFIFPNPYSIYLHDTPGKRLFSRQTRSFSHGCVRVAEPERLAVFLLGEEGNGWDIARVNDMINRGKRSVLDIRPPLPVHITYQTAWVDKDDQIIFNKDLYGRDEKLYNALFIK